MSQLARSIEEQGFRLVAHGELTSTNDEALACARAGDPGWLWVVARSQSAGRGRNGRHWVSEPGNLYASLLLIDPAPPPRAPELGFVVSLALARTLKRILGEAAPIAVKWPNDILCGGDKIAGVLLESAALDAARSGGELACVAGVGVNCASHPKDNLLYPASDLSTVAGRAITPEATLTALAAEMAHWLRVWAQQGGFALIRAEWLKLAAGIGGEVRVARRRGEVRGVFRAIDEAGRLILETGDGEAAIDAGDVFLASPPHGA